MNKLFPLFLILSLFITACGSNAAPVASANDNATLTPTPPAATHTPPPPTIPASRLGVNEQALKDLEISIWSPWYGVEASLFNNLATEFNETNPWGIQVKVNNQVSFTNLYEMTTASLPTTEKPDMVIALPEHALEWDANGVVTELTPYVTDPLYGIDTSDIPSTFWNQDNAGGKRLGIPAQRTARFLLWNETWANELGFESAPDMPAEFNAQACGAHQAMLTDALAENDAMGGWYADTQPMTAYGWLLAFEGGVLDGNSYRFLTPNNIASLRFLRELSESGCSWQAPETNAIEAFTNRQALFMAASLGDLPEVMRAFAAAGNSDAWTVIAFPDSGEGTLVIYGSSYVVLKSTAERQLASWLFIKWLLDNEQDARLAETTHLFPIRSTSLALLENYEKTHPQWSEAIKLLPQGEIQPQVASWRQVKVMLGDAFTHMYRINVSSGQVPAILAQMESIATGLGQ